MSRRTLRPLYFGVFALLASLLLFSNLPSRGVTAQTIPSRTPTPSGGQATATDEPDDPGPNPTAPPTSTNRPPQNTATATRFVLPPTPEDGYLSTAEPCSAEVTARALVNNLNVRSGPSLDYDIVGNLVLMEVRPVTGRAPQAAWWEIVLADGTIGWIADELVEVSGYIGSIPAIDPPALDDMTVTPGTPWAPTPQPQCTPPPTSTPTSTSTPTPTERVTVEVTATLISQEQVEDEENDPEQVAVAQAETATAQVSDSATTEPAAPTPTAAPLPGEEDEADGAGSMWIPVAGVGLILAAAGLFIARRIRR